MSAWPTFDDALEAVRQIPGMRNVRVPSWTGSSGAWRIEQGESGTVLHLDLPAAILEQNLQADAPSSPTFLLCVAWWLGEIHGAKCSCVVRVHGEPAADKQAHVRRSLFLLSEYARLLGEGFRVELPGGLVWAWPAKPLMNAASARLDDGPTPKEGSEAALERWFITSPDVLAFVRCHAPVRALRRQLPVGLFDGSISRATRWTPGAKSAVDAWTVSEDGDELHLFELKEKHNVSVGILPEALYYALLLSRVRAGGSDVAIGGDGPDLDDVRRSKRIVAWLAAPSFHPLLGDEWRTPLAAVNAAMARDDVVVRFLPLAPLLLAA